MPATTDEQKDALRRRILDAASEMLAAHGAAGLSMRKLATKVGASTMVIYTHFDGKPGLFEALYREAFERFERALRAVGESDDVRGDLRRLGHAYRDFALAHPNYYALMFGRAFGDWAPSDETQQTSRRAYGVLQAHVARAWGLDAAETARVASTIWAWIHGLTSLQLARHLPGDAAGQRLFEGQMESLINGFGPLKGD